MKNKILKSLLIFIFIVVVICFLVNISSAIQIMLFVQYNGKLYLQTEQIVYDKEEAKNTILGEYLGITNKWNPEHTDYGTFANGYENFDSSIDGELHTVKGYDREFRVCVLNKSNSSITLFENNDLITEGMKGETFYEDVLHINDNIENIKYQLHSDWDEGKEIYKDFNNITKEDVTKFIEELYNSKFISLNSNLLLNPAQLHIYLNMKDGTTVPLRIFINGYVQSNAGFTKVNYRTVEKLFNLTEIKGKFLKSDIDESKYIVTTHYSLSNNIYIYSIVFAALIIGIIIGVFIIIKIRKRNKDNK